MMRKQWKSKDIHTAESVLFSSSIYLSQEANCLTGPELLKRLFAEWHKALEKAKADRLKATPRKNATDLVPVGDKSERLKCEAANLQKALKRKRSPTKTTESPNRKKSAAQRRKDAAKKRASGAEKADSFKAVKNPCTYCLSLGFKGAAQTHELKNCNHKNGEFEHRNAKKAGTQKVMATGGSLKITMSK